jgi:hypothetical protein
VFLLLLFLIGLIGFSIFTKDQLSRPRVRQTYVSNGDGYEVIETPLPPIEDMEDFASLFPGETPPWIHTVSYEEFSNNQILVLLLGSSLLPLLIGITPIFADTIPLDRQHRIRELLETKPLTKTTYLAGKVLGLWISLVVGMLICAVIYGAIARVLFGVYDALFYAAMWGLIIIPAVLIISGFAVLLASGVGSRRIASLIGALLVPFGLLLSGAILTMMSISGMGLSGYAPLAPVATYSEVVEIVLTNGMQYIARFALGLPVAWGLAWMWTKWDDRRPFPMLALSKN